MYSNHFIPFSLAVESGSRAYASQDSKLIGLLGDTEFMGVTITWMATTVAPIFRN